MGGAALARLATVPLPITDDGARRWSPGLYFCGVHLLRTRGSSLLFGWGRTPRSSPARSPGIPAEPGRSGRATGSEPPTSSSRILRDGCVE
jgi:hypothetical protein